MTKKEEYNIKKHIEKQRERITELLRKRAKHLSDTAWIKSAFIKETLVLHQCADQAIRHETSSESILNINETWNMITSRTNITNFTIHDVMDIHRCLAQDTDVAPCQIRTKSVYNLHTVFEAPASQEVVRQKIDDILYRLNSGNGSILQRAFDAHYELIVLQPFTDFNKRTARMLMSWFLLKRGYLPIAFDHASDNKDYMNALRTRLNGDKKSYYAYMYECMSRTQSQFIRKLVSSR